MPFVQLLIFIPALKSNLFDSYGESLSSLTDFRFIITVIFALIAVWLFLPRIALIEDKQFVDWLKIIFVVIMLLSLMILSALIVNLDYSYIKVQNFALNSVTIAIIIIYFSHNIIVARESLLKWVVPITVMLLLTLLYSIFTGRAFLEADLENVVSEQGYLSTMRGAIANSMAFSNCAIWSTIGMLKYYKRWYYYGASLIISIICLIIIRMRGAVLFGMAVVFIIMMLNLRKMSFKYIVYLIGLSLMIVGFVYIMKPDLFSYAGTYLMDRYSYDAIGVGYNIRKSTADTALNMFFDSPIFGMGLGSFSIYHECEYPHNIIFELMSEWGIIGTIIFLLPVIYVAIKYISIKNKSWRDDPFLFSAILSILLSFKQGGLESTVFIIIFVSALYLETVNWSNDYLYKDPNLVIHHT